MAGERILIVDDDGVSLRLTRFVLEKEGYHVAAAVDGLEALTLVESYCPDVILTDIQLPRMDGLEMTRRLKADLSSGNIPIVALTAYGMKGDEQRAIDAGCDDYLAKPVNAARLLQVIKRRLDRAASEHAGGPEECGPAVMNFDEFSNRTDGDHGLMGELIGLFLEESPVLADAARQAAMEKNPQALQNAAHALKGTVANFSAPRAFEAASVLERMSIDGDMTGAEKAWQSLDREVGILRAELVRIAGQGR